VAGRFGLMAMAKSDKAWQKIGIKEKGKKIGMWLLACGYRHVAIGMWLLACGKLGMKSKNMDTKKIHEFRKM
jgi:hypothetical protein